jgi:hypothetical protein
MYIKKLGIYVKEVVFEDGKLHRFKKYDCEDCWWWHEWFCGYYPIQSIGEGLSYVENDYERKRTSEKNKACSKFLYLDTVIKCAEEQHLLTSEDAVKKED